MSNSAAPTTGEVLAALEGERQAWEALMAEVGEARMLEPGPMGEWTFKDLIAHLNGWTARSVQYLEAAADGQPVSSPAWPASLHDDDAINEWFHAANQDRLLSEVIADSRQSYARLAQLVQRFPEETLGDPLAFPWLEGHSLGEVIVSGEFFSHYHDEHEAQVRTWIASLQR